MGVCVLWTLYSTESKAKWEPVSAGSPRKRQCNNVPKRMAAALLLTDYASPLVSMTNVKNFLHDTNT